MTRSAVHDEIVAALQGGPVPTDQLANTVGRATRTDIDQVIACMWDLDQDGVIAYSSSGHWRLDDTTPAATRDNQTEATP